MTQNHYFKRNLVLIFFARAKISKIKFHGGQAKKFFLEVKRNFFKFPLRYALHYFWARRFSPMSSSNN